MNYRLALAIVFGLLRLGPLAAQSRPADSLRVLLAQSKQLDTTRVRRLQALSDQLLARDHAQASTLAKQALALSRRLHYPAGEGNALIGLATIARLQDNYPLARRCTQQALALYAHHRNAGGLAKAYLQLSLIDEVPGANLVTALREALQGLKYAEQAHRPTTQLYLQYTLGDIYVQLGDYATALETLRVTLRNARQQDNEPVIAATLNLLGNIHKTLRHWPEALACFRRSTQLYRKLGDLQSATTDEINLAELYALQGNNELALRYSRAARREALAHADTHNLPGAELALARAQLNLGQLDSALILAQHGFALSQQARDNMVLANASDILARTYARHNDFAQAYHYQSLWVSYRDSLSGEETQRKTSALRYGYELDKKQSRIAVLDKEKQLQHQQLIGLLAGLAGTVLVLGLLGRNVYLKQRINRALNTKNAQIATQRDDLNTALLALQAAQSQLVQSEKMVALAALTAGVAHEIQNPLNFVNNFSEVSMELVAELEEEEQKPVRNPALEAGLLTDLKQNLRKIHQHGSRAGDIVKGMLEHARADVGQRQPVDLNTLAQDYLRLAYHGLPAKHRATTVARTLSLDPSTGLLPLVPQEIGRVLLNLFTNALYAVLQKAALAGPGYAPEVRVSTQRRGGQVVLRVRDNGTGIPAAVVAKIFDPFFTTKPAGEGTGLGLWFSYDIITKGYGGTLTVETKEGEFTEFTVTLPVADATAAAGPSAGQAAAGWVN